jgi:hypothetical protein
MLRVLEEATQENGYYGGFRMSIWLMMKSRLAQLYREMGAADDAHKIETKLLRLLAYADEDHPILVQLRRVQGK